MAFKVDEDLKSEMGPRKNPPATRSWELDLPTLIKELNKTLKQPSKPLEVEILDSRKNTIVLIAVDHRKSERCWYDHHHLSSEAIHCPLVYLPPDLYKATGSFCSFECALAYANERAKDPSFRDAVNLLYQLFDLSYPGEEHPSASGVDFRSLRAYGGHLDIQTFRSGLHAIKQTPNWVDLATLGRVTTS